ncbi:MAG: homoserine dehydrogenase [Acidobacteriaceae bacterium]|nr:homoserine dehydrogenase [Acidobacteriaceae bacterium]
MRTVLVGFGSVGKAFVRLLERKRSVYPFRVVGIHTRTHGTSYDDKGLTLDAEFAASAQSIEEFLERAAPEVMIEVTTLNPTCGQPAISHISAAFSRGVHVVTANKGPIAHAYATLREQARAAQVEFRFESTVMDGAPVFNQFRNNLPGVNVLAFTGALNSTTKVIVTAMQQGLTFAEGVLRAQALGIAEADVSYDVDGWDSAAKGAAIANVLMGASVTPALVKREGLGELKGEELRRLAAEDKTIVLVSRGTRTADGSIQLQVTPEILPRTDMLASGGGTSNVLLFDTDLMGTIGTVTVNPGVEQTAYGLFSDLVDIAKTL